MSELISRTYKLTRGHIGMLEELAGRNERSMSAQLRFLISQAHAEGRRESVARAIAAGQMTDEEAYEVLERVALEGENEVYHTK